MARCGRRQRTSRRFNKLAPKTKNVLTDRHYMHIHLSMLTMQERLTDGAPIASLPCACANLRRASRAVTQLYDQELRKTGLRVTQFSLLATLALRDRIRHGKVGKALGMDSTTLSRTLRPLESKGWIRAVPGEDRRERHWELTPAGRRQLERASPLWDRAQMRLRAVLGDGEWEALQAALTRTTRAAQRA